MEIFEVPPLLSDIIRQRDELIATGYCPYSINLNGLTWDTICAWFEHQGKLVTEQWHPDHNALYGLHVIVRPEMRDGTARVLYSEVEEMRREHERQEDA